MGKKYYKRASTKNDWLYSIPILAIVLFVPMIVLLKVNSVDSNISKLMLGMEVNYDFFAFYKANLFTFATGLVVLATFLYMFTKGLKFNRTIAYIPLIIYVAAIIISTVVSPYKELSLAGTIDRYEGFYALLSYLLICAVCVNMVNNEKVVRYLMISLGTSAIIISLIGLFQLIGCDLFKSDFGLKLIIPAKYHELIGNVNFKFTQIYTTFTNPNYVGSYMAMIILLSLTYLIFIKGKRYKIFAALVLILSLVNLFGSRSRGGLIGLVFGLMLLLIIAARQMLKNKIIIIGAIAGIIVVFGAVNSFTDGLLVNRLVGIVQFTKQDNTSILKIIPMDDKLLMTSDGDESYLFYDNNDVVFQNTNQEEIEVLDVDGILKLAGEKHKSLTFSFSKYNDLPVLEVSFKSLKVSIIPLGDKYMILNPANQLVEITEVESWGFEGYERLGSSRGYIWSRTLPLLKENILYGQGPDTYALAFPQNDVFGKYIALSDPWMVVDKPHNMYLQIGVNTGVISLLAFLALYLIYFFQSILLYIRGNIDNIYMISGVALFLATAAYMAVGFFNDSVVAVAPIFWVLLGSGISMNIKNKAERLKTSNK